MAKPNSTLPKGNASATTELLNLITRIERLEKEKKELLDDLNDVKLEAKGKGFSVKAILRIVKERAEDAGQRAARQEVEELTEVYRAALGMLDGTPLGEAARKRLAEPPHPAGDDDDEPLPVASEPVSAESIDDARQAGREAHASGAGILSNPYVAGDPRRAAWDEGWCLAAGSDGMDIPKAWRRTEKKKSPDAPEGEG